jgi:hypothetical protein
MPDLLLGVYDTTTAAMTVGQPTHIVGNEVMAVTPDPVTNASPSAGLYSSDGPDLELTFQPTIAPAVTLSIDIWVQRTKFQKLIVTSSDPVNYPIQGKFGRETSGGFWCIVTVGPAAGDD